jgi:hypothetical protein
MDTTTRPGGTGRPWEIMKKLRLQLATLILALASAQSAEAVDLTALYDNAGAPNAFGLKVLEAFQGKDLKGKDGPLHKIGMDLIVAFQEFQDFQASGGRKALGKPFKPSGPLIRSHEETVLINAVADGDAEALRQDLIALGLQQAAVFGRMVSGYLPIQALRDAAALGTLRLARPAYAMTLAGAVTSQGDAAMRSNLARPAFRVDGSGVMVGTLSDSYNCKGGAASDAASGDLPLGVTVLQEEIGCGSGTDEGRAMMQIVHDVAPGSPQAFHSAFNGEADFANGILDLANVGAKVITDDVIWLDEPMFQDGPIAQAVDAVKAAGVAYFSSAGNQTRHSYEDTFRDSGRAGHSPSSTRHDFIAGSGTDTLQQITIPVGSTVIFVFQWQDRYASVSGSPGAASDLDFVLYSSTGQYQADATDDNIGGDPVEILGYTNYGPQSTFQIGLERVSGPAPGRIKYVYFGSVTLNQFATNSASLYGHANAAGAQAVGAANYLNTPAFGVSPPLLESYSSAGGTRILFDVSGAPVNQLRQKPEIVAPDGGDTTFFYPNSDSDGTGFPNFFGTSAAAPHAAGVAALLRDLDPTITPDGIYAALQGTALDMKTAGFDYDSGHGLIQADAALASRDSDSDGVSNAVDLCPGTAAGQPADANGCSAFQKDTDNDGLSDGLEASIGTNPSLPDSDGDGLSDFDEVNWDGDPATYNSAGDLNPLAADTDNDGFQDGMEFAASYNPLSAASFPVWGDINDDRVVDTADVLLASRAVMGLVTLTDAELARGKVAPLVNGTPRPALNDPFNAADLLLIERKALGEVAF